MRRTETESEFVPLGTALNRIIARIEAQRRTQATNAARHAGKAVDTGVSADGDTACRGGAAVPVRAERP